MMIDSQPIVGVIMGDPAGIGPEVIVKVYQQLLNSGQPIVIGDADVLTEATAVCDTDLAVDRVETVDDAQFSPDAVPVLDIDNVETLILGEVREEYDVASVNYPTLPRSGLLAPWLLRVGLPVSVSELAFSVDTAAPDSAGGFSLQVVRSVPLLPAGHLATTDDARFLSRLNTAGDVVSIVLCCSTVGVSKCGGGRVCEPCGAVFPPYSLPPVAS